MAPTTYGAPSSKCASQSHVQEVPPAAQPTLPGSRTQAVARAVRQPARVSEGHGCDVAANDTSPSVHNEVEVAAIGSGRTCPPAAVAPFVPRLGFAVCLERNLVPPQAVSCDLDVAVIVSAHCTFRDPAPRRRWLQELHQSHGRQSGSSSGGSGNGKSSSYKSRSKLIIYLHRTTTSQSSLPTPCPTATCGPEPGSVAARLAIGRLRGARAEPRQHKPRSAVGVRRTWLQALAAQQPR